MLPNSKLIRMKAALRAALFRLTGKGKACIPPRVMENQTANIDLSALDTEAMLRHNANT